MLNFNIVADVQLSALFSDNMVLQQNKPIHVWGRATVNEIITISLSDAEHTSTKAVSNQNGKWETYLKPVKSGIYSLQIESEMSTGEKQSLTIHNVAVGEVWLASGQSNMEWPVKKSLNKNNAKKMAAQREIRFFKVSKETALTPKEDVKGQWIVMTADAIEPVSAVAYYYAQNIQQALGVPVGIIQSTWSNTKIATWIKRNVLAENALEKNTKLNILLDKADKEIHLPLAEKQKLDELQKTWEAKNFAQDSATIKNKQTYLATINDSTKRQKVNLPVTFNTLGFKDEGAIWFKKNIEIPLSWENKDVSIHLGIIDDFDEVYINNKLIGATGREQQHHWLTPRQYQIPKKILKIGGNKLAVRIFDRYGDGGFMSEPQSLFLQQGREKISLVGEWDYQEEYRIKPKAPDWASKPMLPFGLANQNTPSVLYNSMIAPLAPYTLNGVIWYQGESDADNYEQYQVTFPLLIKSWRKAWGEPLAFLFVQLANYQPTEADPSYKKWAGLRKIQANTQKNMSNTGMITAIDLGETKSVHPRNKKMVGDRLALWALANVYHHGERYQAPVYDGMELLDYDKISKHMLKLSFINAKGLYSKGKITAFELADKTGKYHQAEARIEGTNILVWSKSVEQPTRVRYAWKDNPIANIYNSVNLPLKPFLKGDID